LSYEDQEYHRRRSEIELEQAASADAEESALSHLILARMHRARRQAITVQSRKYAGRPGIFGADKES
jgi:hypothetical protein